MVLARKPGDSGLKNEWEVKEAPNIENSQQLGTEGGTVPWSQAFGRFG